MALTNKERRRRYYLKHIDTIKEKAKERYKREGRKRGPRTDETRTQDRERVRHWREANPEKYEAYRKKQSLRSRERTTMMKREIMTHYGAGQCRCVKCGESRLACLSIDHIDGGGTKERRDTALTSYAYYLSLKNQGYPKGYQTLCMNCQFVKRFENNESKPRRW